MRFFVLTAGATTLWSFREHQVQPAGNAGSDSVRVYCMRRLSTQLQWLTLQCVV